LRALCFFEYPPPEKTIVFCLLQKFSEYITMCCLINCCVQSMSSLVKRKRKSCMHQFTHNKKKFTKNLEKKKTKCERRNKYYWLHILAIFFWKMFKSMRTLKVFVLLHTYKPYAITLGTTINQDICLMGILLKSQEISFPLCLRRTNPIINFFVDLVTPLI
jgi:hypothetical protein